MFDVMHYNKFAIIILLSFLVQCSDDPGDKKTEDGNTTCIVTDKAYLEDLSVFPSDNPVNQDISNLPVDNRSDAIINLIGTVSLKADFGSGLWEGAPIEIPFIHVCATK